MDFEEFIYRAVTPTFWDLFFGTILIILILEATRRTTSWILPRGRRLLSWFMPTSARGFPRLGPTADTAWIAWSAICT